MNSMRRSWWLAVVFLFVNCATLRTWQLPLSPVEGSTYAAALLSVAQNERLEAYRGPNNSVNVELPDGTLLSWGDSANHAEFLLFIHLPSETPEPAYDERFQAAKVRADELWEKATLARRSLAIGPVAAAVPTSCMTGSDGSQACGYHCMMGSNGRTACAPTPDGSCHLNSSGTVSCGRNCQFTSGGTWSCW